MINLDPVFAQAAELNTKVFPDVVTSNSSAVELAQGAASPEAARRIIKQRIRIYLKSYE